mgnify:FL=1
MNTSTRFRKTIKNLYLLLDQLIDFGLEKGHYPFRPHENDVGADVYMPYDCTLKPGEIAKIPLGFGLMIPAIVEKSTPLSVM